MAKKIIIVTGPIGSGKSTTIEYLRKKGFQTLDLDKISNEIINSNESIKFLDTNFPGVIKNQKLDKDSLADIVFNDNDKLKTLEEYLHPKILIEFQQIAAKIDGVLFVEVSAPKNIHKDFECLVISTPEAVRIERLLDRDMKLNDIKNRIQTQQNEDWWNSLGHVIINNSHTSLEQEIDKYINEKI